MNKISCHVCLDLMPLVLDGVASEDSVLLVQEHVKMCNNCHEVYGSHLDLTSYEVDDQKVIKHMKKSLYLVSLTILLIGSILGISLSNSMGMFYNFTIMPVCGIVGYFILSRRWYLMPLGIFISSYLWMFIGYLFEGKFTLDMIFFPFFLSGIYTILTVIGAIIAALLKFAFSKGE